MYTLIFLKYFKGDHVTTREIGGAPSGQASGKSVVCFVNANEKK